MICTLTSGPLSWNFAWEPGAALRTSAIQNLATGRTLTPGPGAQCAVVLSSSPDAVESPRRVDDFVVESGGPRGEAAAAFTLRSPLTALTIDLDVEVRDGVRRTRTRVVNGGDCEVLLLDIVLDELALDAPVTTGAQGFPAFIEEEWFAAVEHPSGWNELVDGRLRLMHCPGRCLTPGASMEAAPALMATAPRGQARTVFLRWIEAHCLRLRRGVTSIYAPFGINNQWGLAGTLDDEQALHVLGQIGRMRRKGARFDFFTLDTGWADYGGDLKRFRPVAFPEGGQEVVRRARSLGMDFGLWFATSWASQSCWDNPAAWGQRGSPRLTWRNGNPALADYTTCFCMAAPPYYEMLKEAVLYHVRENGVRFLKFDGGNYACDDPSHGHLTGRWATEHMHNMLIELSAAVRTEAPDTFIMWYWGLRSPFWALHGDTIFESGLFMEGSGTSSFPAMHYRDSVTLAQDQNARHASLVPPVTKDSLGVWLADTRWGNFLGKSRWREAIVMDLGRGNLLFPNIWGDLYLLEDEDVEFLAGMERLAKRWEPVLLTPRRDIGDPMVNEPYGYAYGDGKCAIVFLNNVSFASREVVLSLGEPLGLELPAGRRLRVRSFFPEQRDLLDDQGGTPCAGQTLTVRLRPFETLLLEVRAGRARSSCGRTRDVDAAQASRLGVPLALQPVEGWADLQVIFADEARMTAAGAVPRQATFTTQLPDLGGAEMPFLCVPVRLSKNGAEYKHVPYVADAVQVTARVGTERVFFTPVPDARQFGNTQKAGCSWVVYRTRMPRRWADLELRLAVHSLLPADVQVATEAWVVRRWWQESARPEPDGYYAEAPS